MKVKSQRRYSLEFKIKVVQESLDTTDTVKMVANKYGIHPDMLSSWRSHMTSKNQGPDKSYTDLERQIRKLEKQLEDAQLENDVLKKAKAYFDSLKE